MADDPYPLLRHAEPVMGTVVSFAVRTDDSSPATVEAANQAIAEAVALLHALDARFSTYKPESEVSRIASGLLPTESASAELVEVLDRCAEVTRLTDGYFTTHPWGSFDPSGLVKGWAVERASEMLVVNGFGHHSVAGGGDVQVRGQRAPGRQWTVGIADPHRPGEVIATLPLTDGAIATSGTAERGAHVVNPHTGRAAQDLASVSLVGRSLAVVDAYATAALAMGRSALAWVARQDDLEALTVAADGTVAWSAGWPGTRPARP